jgi:hypothetical protein
MVDFGFVFFAQEATEEAEKSWNPKLCCLCFLLFKGILWTTARRIGQADQREAGSPASNDCPVGQSLRSHQ